METLIKANRTKRAKVAILCMSAMFLCNHAFAQNTFTVSEKENIKGNECTKTFSCYYGDNDERIMHGLCKTVGKENIVNDKDHKYSFYHTESINYSHGKKEGAYSFQQKVSTTTTAVYHDYQTDGDYVQRSSVNNSIEIAGSYKDDERDGVWKETIKVRDTLWEPYSRKVERTNIKDEKNTFVYSKGNLVELTTKDAHYKFRYENKDGRDIALLNGIYDKYTVKDGVIVSHIVRLNGDETPIESDLKQFIDSKENLFEHQDELLEKGYILEEALWIGYKQCPNIDGFDYNSCTIYKIKKEQITYASIDDIEKYLSGVREKEFDEKMRELMASKHFWSGGKKYVKDSDLTELQSAVKRYKEMLAQIQSGREQIAQLKNKIKENSLYGREIEDLLDSYGNIQTDFPFTTDSSEAQERIDEIRECLKMEEDFYSFVVKGEKQKIIAAKTDTIKNMAGENSQIWKQYLEIYNKHYQYIYGNKKESYDDLVRRVRYGREKGEAAEMVKQYMADVNEGIVIADNCLDYARALTQLNELKEDISASPYFSHVKTKYDGTIASLGNGWNGQENGDGLRQQTAKLEQYKNHLENIAAIEKNNEKIVQLAVKAKNIKKIYAKYYNSIQKEYTDNTPADYLPTIISNQNALIAALEANDAKDLDKTVKKGKAETMEDIIRIIKQQ